MVRFVPMRLHFSLQKPDHFPSTRPLGTCCVRIIHLDYFESWAQSTQNQPFSQRTDSFGKSPRAWVTVAVWLWDECLLKVNYFISFYFVFSSRAHHTRMLDTYFRTTWILRLKDLLGIKKKKMQGNLKREIDFLSKACWNLKCWKRRVCFWGSPSRPFTVFFIEPVVKVT